MREYHELGHMTEMISPDSLSGSRCCYLSHHGVLRGTAPSIKLCVVFNGSLKTRVSNSLNANLLVGLNLIPQLARILLNWRCYRYVFTADIEKMYRQILVHSED